MVSLAIFSFVAMISDKKSNILIEQRSRSNSLIQERQEKQYFDGRAADKYYLYEKYFQEIRRILFLT